MSFVIVHCRVGRPNDCSQNNLFSSVDKSIFTKPVYKKLISLYDNYINNIAVKEEVTAGERKEENEFIDEVMRSTVMKETLKFLRQENVFKKSENEFKDLLRQLWFDVYSRGQRILGSSGFEHVFLGEKKNGTVQGFHNWVYFYHLEQKNQLNYLGHWTEVDLRGKGTGLSFTFKWDNDQKPFASMSIGTSPQLELAPYTVCILVREEQDCRVSLSGKQFNVRTHIFKRPRGVKYVASAFIEWK